MQFWTLEKKSNFEKNKSLKNIIYKSLKRVLSFITPLTISWESLQMLTNNGTIWRECYENLRLHELLKFLVLVTKTHLPCNHNHINQFKLVLLF